MAGAHVVLYRKVRNRRGSLIPAVLLIKRTQDAPSHPGHWSLVGGKLEPGETPKAGLLWRTGSLDFYRAHLAEDMDSLRLKRSSADKKVEGEGLSWFTEAEARRLPMRSEDRMALRKYFSLRRDR